MAVRVIERRVLETDTPEEMVALLKGLNWDVSKFQPAALPAGPIALTLSFHEAAKAFIGRLNHNQRELINHLAVDPEGRSDAQLREAFGKESNQALAGILGAVTKHAAAVGRDVAEFLISTKKPKHYRLSPPFLDYLHDMKS